MKHSPVTQLTVPDALAASAAGLTETQWRGMTDQERNWHRWNITSARRTS